MREVYSKVHLARLTFRPKIIVRSKPFGRNAHQRGRVTLSIRYSIRMSIIGGAGWALRQLFAFPARCRASAPQLSIGR
jgi:hypothetical protein